ncbi:uncharacterized protein LOC121836457, partial [Ixodes scapularis]|uniref:uncharacterized protein LOC121836457 n=1 Tax=Ixodes scapularis TaxID=6945 RepID=UPI001C389B29
MTDFAFLTQHHNDEARIRTNSEIQAEDCLELLSFYLKSTFKGWRDNIYAQKSGVCIGSRLTKSHIHKMKASFSAEIARLRHSNFPNRVISSACDKLIRNSRKIIEAYHIEKKKTMCVSQP